MWRGLAAGALAGASWGVVARLFMRLLTDTPDFSWAGTLLIVALGGVAGACAGLVHAARTTGRSRWWRLAALPALVLFAGPGSLLAPAAVGMALVLRGRAAVRVLGTLLVLVPVAVVLTTPPTAPTRLQVAGLALMVLSTAPLGWGVGEVVRRWRPRPETTATDAALGGTALLPALG